MKSYNEIIEFIANMFVSEEQQGIRGDIPYEELEYIYGEEANNLVQDINTEIDAIFKLNAITEIRQRMKEGRDNKFDHILLESLLSESNT